MLDHALALILLALFFLAVMAILEFSLGHPELLPKDPMYM